MQEYNRIEDTEYISDAPSQLNKNMESIATDFSGASFPTENLFVGMKCLRTDENKIYRLYENASNQLVWQPEYIIVDGGIKVKEANHAIQADDLPTSKYATQAQAEEGVDNTKVMTPLRTKNAIDKQRPIKTYTTLGELGLTAGSETLVSVLKAMQDNSMAVLGITNNNNVSQYPTEYGVLVVHRQKYDIGTFEFISRNLSKMRNWWTVSDGNKGIGSWKELLSNSDIATQSQAEAGTDNTTVMTPKGVDYRLNKDRKWKTYNSIWDVTSLDVNITFEEIFNKLTGSSFARFYIDARMVNLEVPLDSAGYLNCYKQDGNLIVYLEQHNKKKVYFGTYIGGVFSGWKQLATQGALSMPSGNKINIGAVEHFQTYIAPADGWGLLTLREVKGVAQIANMTSGLAITNNFTSVMSNWEGFIPLRKGDTCRFATGSSNSYSNAVFVYAQSEV